MIYRASGIPSQFITEFRIVPFPRKWQNSILYLWICFYGIMDTLFIIYTLTYCFKSVCLTLKKHYTDLIKFGRLTFYIVNIHQYVIVYNTSHGYICRVPFVEILDCCPLNLTKTFFILNLLCSWTLINPFKFYWDILVENVKKTE